MQARVSGVTDDQLDVALEDAELLAEVELTTDLIIAASAADGSLPQAVVDRLLGLSETRDAAPASPPRPLVPRQSRYGG